MKAARRQGCAGVLDAMAATTVGRALVAPLDVAPQTQRPRAAVRASSTWACRSSPAVPASHRS